MKCAVISSPWTLLRRTQTRLVIVLMALARETLLLKAKVMEKSEDDDNALEWALADMKKNYHEHMALEAKRFWSGNKGRGSKPRDYTRDFSRDSPRDRSRYSRRENLRGYSNSPTERGQRARTCYSCGDKNHFVAT
jgi:hypothetical protein